MTRPTDSRSGGLYGSLEIMILKTLDQFGSLHGLDIARSIQERSKDYLTIEEGALYPALHRLQKRGLIEGGWRKSAKGRRARFYDLTEAGRSYLRDELQRWLDNTTAIGKVLGIERPAD